MLIKLFTVFSFIKIQAELLELEKTLFRALYNVFVLVCVDFSLIEMGFREELIFSQLQTI